MAIISVPKSLREKLGEDGSEALVNLINQQSDSVKGDVIKIAEEKFERRLSDEMAKVNERITTEIAKVNERITEETAKLRISISQVQTNLIRWMFIFWIGQFGMMLGLFFAFTR